MKTIFTEFPKLKDNRTIVAIMRRRTGHGKEGASQRLDIPSAILATPAVPTAAETSKLDKSSTALGPGEVVPPENTDPSKPSVDLSKQARGLKRLVRHLKSVFWRNYHYLRPVLTVEQQEEKEHLQTEQRFEKLMRLEAVKYSKLISNKLSQLGYKHIDAATRRKHQVRFDVAAFNDNGTEIVLHAVVDPRLLPDGVRLVDLANDGNVNEIMYTVGHPVIVNVDIEGLTYRIQRAGKEGLPDFITATEMWDQMPENKPPLSFPVGIAENARKVWVDLDDCPHLLVAGSTKQGKSNMINTILCTYVRRLDATQVRFVLFDLKEGMEFSFYENLPHLLPTDNTPGIIENMDQVLDAMKFIQDEMYRRLKVIRNKGFKNFNDYNLHSHGKNKLGSLVVVFDEWATIALTLPGAETILTKMSNMARAAGIYLIIGTQNPRADVLSTLIKLNFQVRLAFNVDFPASLTILGNRDAVGLACRGRAVFQYFDEHYQVQTPRITDENIRSSVHKAITGQDIQTSKLPVNIEEILQYSLDKMEGRLEIDRLYEVYRHQKVKLHPLKELMRTIENQEFNLGGTMYRVEPRGYHTPRRLVLIDQVTLTGDF